MIKQKHFYCSHCKKRGLIEDAVITPAGKFCDNEHLYLYAIDKQNKQRLVSKGKAIKQKAANKKSREDKKKVRKRSVWYDMLNKLQQQYVTKVRDVGKPCRTCGTSDPYVEYHGGHFIPQKGSDSRRFYIKQINIQCHACNTYGGGKPAEYEQFMIAEYGQDYVNWLKADKNHPSLKEQYPNWQDIEAEILIYRKLIRESGLTPCR